ncbi:helix-turn-helix transcriptional regulator [Rhizobium leguminosarum]
MEKILEEEARRIKRLGFKSDIARGEVANPKSNRPTGPPPFDAILISLNQCCQLTSLSRTAINRWRGLGLFPQAVPLGDKRVAFVRAEVEQWVNDRIAERLASRKARNSAT